MARPDDVDDEEVEKQGADEDDGKPEERLNENVPAGQRGVVVAVEGVRCRVREATGPVARRLPAAGQRDRAVVDRHAHRLEEGAAAAARGSDAHRIGHADAISAAEGVAPPETARGKRRGREIKACERVIHGRVTVATFELNSLLAQRGMFNTCDAIYKWSWLGYRSSHRRISTGTYIETGNTLVTYSTATQAIYKTEAHLVHPSDPATDE